MTINYRKIREAAERSGLSKFLLAKRQLGYGFNGHKGMCKNCGHVCLPTIKGVKRLQCVLVGVGDDYYADVKPRFCCKKGFKLRREQISVIAEYLKENNL